MSDVKYPHTDEDGKTWYMHPECLSPVYDRAPEGHVWRRASPMSAICVFCEVVYQQARKPTTAKCPKRTDQPWMHPDPACAHPPESICQCVCHTRLVLHDSACCDICFDCGARIRVEHPPVSVAGGHTGHHYWCNFFGRDPQDCKTCKRLWEQYPYDPNKPGEAEALQLKHFPDSKLRLT